MKVQYLCPHCRAALNARDHIILVAKKPNNGDNRGLVLLHEEIGNYSVAMSGTLDVKTGGIVDFYCPVCSMTINSGKGDNLASFIRVDEIGEESTIVISRAYGDHSTFQINDRGEVKSYGQAIRKYMDPEWFLK